MAFVRSLGVAGLVAGVVGTGLPVSVAGGAVGVQALVRRLDDGGQVTGAGVRRGQEAVPRRRYRRGAVSGAARVRRDGGGGRRGGRRQGARQRRERRLGLQAVLADQHLHGGHHVACRQTGRFSFVFPVITIIVIVRRYIVDEIKMIIFYFNRNLQSDKVVICYLKERRLLRRK